MIKKFILDWKEKNKVNILSKGLYEILGGLNNRRTAKNTYQWSDELVALHRKLYKNELKEIEKGKRELLGVSLKGEDHWTLQYILCMKECLKEIFDWVMEIEMGGK